MGIRVLKMKDRKAEYMRFLEEVIFSLLVVAAAVLYIRSKSYYQLPGIETPLLAAIALLALADLGLRFAPASTEKLFSISRSRKPRQNSSGKTMHSGMLKPLFYGMVVLLASVQVYEQYAAKTFYETYYLLGATILVGIAHLMTRNGDQRETGMADGGAMAVLSGATAGFIVFLKLENLGVPGYLLAAATALTVAIACRTLIGNENHGKKRAH